MFWISKSIHYLNRFRRQLLVFFAVLGPGIIVMVADNDAGGISTYAVTGSKYGFNLLFIFIVLVPMAYYVQEMTVRLGAVTKRGHAEAIFDGFGPFWGWFSLADLAVVNWLTLITEYIGMTAALSLFGVPPWITVIVVTLVLVGMVMSGRYWTFEKVTLFFCLFNLVYIPAAFWAMEMPSAPSWSKVFDGFYRPDLHGGLTGDLLFLLLANIGTTIAPWMIFFQQSAVVDKGIDVKDIVFGKIETFVGSLATCLVAVFIIVATAAAFYYHQPPSSSRMRRKPLRHWRRSCTARVSWPSGCSPSACSTLASSAPSASRCPPRGPWGRCSGGPIRSTGASETRPGSTSPTS